LASVIRASEVESGKKADRPQLAEALAACKRHRAKLVIAKLDRLSRNVHFISGLMERKVDFVACDMPNADPFMLHIYASVAEQERRMISARTKAGLAAARARGVKLGNPNLAEAQHAAALARDTDLRPVFEELRGLSYQRMAQALTCRAIPAPRGGSTWNAMTAMRVAKRLGIATRVAG
jgi:DNA invertase Pin-like site-specific DNA recombinase